MTQPKRTKPRIVLWDLETLPDMSEAIKFWPGLSNYPGLTLKAQINSVICFGYKIFGEKEVHCINAWDLDPDWNINKNNDGPLLKKAMEILSSADSIVTHNGKKFDLKFFRTRLAKYGLADIPKTIHADTCAVSRTNHSFFNNKLDNIAEFLGLQRKKEHEGWNLWVRVWHGDKKAQKEMSEYCKQDIRVLNDVYKKLMPTIRDIPNYNHFDVSEKPMCTKCGSTRMYRDRTRATSVAIYQRWRCKDCGGMSQRLTDAHVLRPI